MSEKNVQKLIDLWLSTARAERNGKNEAKTYYAPIMQASVQFSSQFTKSPSHKQFVQVKSMTQWPPRQGILNVSMIIDSVGADNKLNHFNRINRFLIEIVQNLFRSYYIFIYFASSGGTLW